MNTNNSILLIDPEFDPQTAPDCNLLVKVGIDSFSYAIINKRTKQVNAVFDEQECTNSIQKFADRLKTDSYFSLPYREIKVAIHTENSISIPNELYSEEDLGIHSQFFSDPETENLFVQQNTAFGFTTVFTLPALADHAQNTLNEAQKYPQNAGLLALAAGIEKSALVFDFTVGSFNVVYVKQQKVVFQQVYETENSEEFNYYVLLLVNQLNIDTKTTEIYLCGIVHHDDEKYNRLHQYFENIEFLTLKTELDQSVLDDMPIHYYSHLLALDQCV